MRLLYIVKNGKKNPKTTTTTRLMREQLGSLDFELCFGVLDPGFDAAPLTVPFLVIVSRK